MGTAKKAKYPIGFYICCITYTFERFAFYGTKPLLSPGRRKLPVSL